MELGFKIGFVTLPLKSSWEMDGPVEKEQFAQDKGKDYNVGCRKPSSFHLTCSSARTWLGCQERLKRTGLSLSEVCDKVVESPRGENRDNRMTENWESGRRWPREVS